MRETDVPMARTTRAIAIPKTPALLATAALILVGLVVLYIKTYEMMPSLLPGYPGDAFFPRLVIGFTAIFTVLILAGGAWRYANRATRAEAAPAASLDWIETSLVAILCFAYIALLDPLGFELTTTGFLAILLAGRLLMPWPRAIPIAFASAAATTVLLYLVFVLWLNVGVPLLFLPRYLG